MAEIENEVFDLDDLDEWTEFAIAQGWSDGLPLVVPTEAAVDRFVAVCHGDNEPFPIMPLRQIRPTLRSIAANAVMAGCRPEYFPVVLAALRAVLMPGYGLGGSLATTHPCAPVIVVNGQVRRKLAINCGGNCFGQGWRANATIGRALQLILLNLGGAKPGGADMATQGTPAKYSFCFGENEEASPWPPYHVRRGFQIGDDVVSVMSAEAPHNINDHGSTSAEELLVTIVNTIAQPGANNVHITGPYMLVLAPEFAGMLSNAGWTIQKLQERLHEQARVHYSKLSAGNRALYEKWGHRPVGDYYRMSTTPEEVHIIVAGGAGKHSAWIPSFATTDLKVCSTRVRSFE